MSKIVVIDPGHGFPDPEHVGMAFRNMNAPLF